jgi:hypothetical protein
MQLANMPHNLKHFWKTIALIAILSIALTACGQDQAEQDGAGDSDVSEEAADVAQESEELAEAVGEEIEEGAEDVEQAGATAVEQGQEAGATAVEQGQEAGATAVEQGQEAGATAEQAGETAAEQAEEAGATVLPQELTDNQGVTVSDLDDNLEAFTGRMVAVRGDVVEIMGPHAFQLDDPSTLGGDTILVAGQNVDTSTLNMNSTVEVSGEVQRFNLVTLEENTGLDFEDELFSAFEDDNAVIIPQEVMTIESGGAY